MAKIAAYPGWYKGDDVLLRQDITEVEVVSEYSAPENTPSWNASTDENDPIPAYLIGTKLVLVCPGLMEIPELMFNRFVSLKKATGLAAVNTVRSWAFYCTPGLESTDLDPSNLVFVGNDAFRLSGIEGATNPRTGEKLDFSRATNADIEARATRSKRWTPETLEAIRGVDFPKYIYLDVPDADSQLDYAKVDYATKGGDTISVADGGCRTLTTYHMWKCLYAGTSIEQQYPTFIEWFKNTLDKEGRFDEGNFSTNTTMEDDCRPRDYEYLGWLQTKKDPIESEKQLEDIIDRLAYGFPVEITIRGNTSSGYHTVLIIGCDPETHKLAVVDSGVRIEYGVVYWIAYEDLCTEGAEDAIEAMRYINYKPPVLAAGNTWFSQGDHGIAKSAITEIEIVREYTPTGSETASWDASATLDKKVMAYLNGTKLTIAGNGYRFIWGNSDSSYMFSDSSPSNWFKSVTRINGAEHLNTRGVKTIMGILSGCQALTFINYGGWDMSNCEAMNSAFQCLKSYKRLDFSNWSAPKVTTLRMAFQGNSNYPSGLISIKGLGGIGTEALTDISVMCNGCNELEEIDVRDLNVTRVTEEKKMLNAFNGCRKIRYLDFSNWDNRAAGASADMLTGTRLEKITLGENFRLNGFTLPEPTADLIPCADGNWYDEAYTPYPHADVVAAYAIGQESAETRTLYSSKYWLEGLDDQIAIVNNGFLKQLAMVARRKSGETDKIYPADALKVLALDLAT